MDITLRAYEHNKDFDAVSSFLINTYIPKRYPNWPQARWEYMHYHPNLDQSSLRKIGVWEDSGKIIGVAHYEAGLGEAHFELNPNYSYLIHDMLKYSEEHLFAVSDDGKRNLRIFINDFNSEFRSIAESRGYIREDWSDWQSEFVIPHPFPAAPLPPGYKIISLADENDLYKIDRCLWRGFNHPGEPPCDGVEGRRLMQSAPNFSKELNIVAAAPDGQFVAYAGTWYDNANKVAMVEPVATDPDFRRMGLGRAAVLEGIRRCGELGAKTAIVGSDQEFYLSFGFRRLFARLPYVRQF